jgi:hypothetical protein
MPVPFLKLRAAAGDVGFGGEGDIPGKSEPVEKQRVLRPDATRPPCPRRRSGRGPARPERRHPPYPASSGSDSVGDEATQSVSSRANRPSLPARGFRQSPNPRDGKRSPPRCGNSGQNGRTRSRRTLNGPSAFVVGHYRDRMARNHSGRHLEGEFPASNPGTFTHPVRREAYSAPPSSPRRRNASGTSPTERALPSASKNATIVAVARRTSTTIHTSACCTVRRTQRRKESFHGIASSQVFYCIPCRNGKKGAPPPFSTRIAAEDAELGCR